MTDDTDLVPIVPDDQRNVLYSRGVLAGVATVATVACIAIVFAVAPDDWGTLRTLAAGTFFGAWCFFCVFVNHVLISGGSDG